MKANAQPWRAGRRERLSSDPATSIAAVAGYDKHPLDPGALGIITEVEQLTDAEAFYQFEELRSASPAMQALARVRMAALRRRLTAEEAAP